MTVHREGGNAALAMTGCAVFCQNRRDVRDIGRDFGHCLVGHWLTADCNFRHRHLVTGQNLIERGFSPGHGTPILYGKAGRIKDQHLAAIGDSHRFGDHPVIIHQHRKVAAESVHLRRHFSAVLEAHRVDQQKLDASGVKLISQRKKPG